MRKFILFICGVVILAVFAAIGMSLAQGGSLNDGQVYKLVAVGILAGILIVRLGRDRRHSSVRPEPVQYWTSHERDDRPVMFYKGEVFDFVHNDPTASM